MTKLEYIETKRKGMVELCSQLQQYYEKNDNSFGKLTLDALFSMIRKLDDNSFIKDANREIFYEECYYCEKIKPYKNNVEE